MASGRDYSQVDKLGVWYKSVNFGAETIRVGREVLEARHPVEDASHLVWGVWLGG